MDIPIYRKYALTIEEASSYFNIGDNKLREIVRSNMDSDFVLQNGRKVIIKRRKFEEWLDATSSL